MSFSEAMLLSVLPAISTVCCGWFVSKQASIQYRWLVGLLGVMSLCQVVAYSFAPKFDFVSYLAAHLYLVLSYFLFTSLVLFTAKVAQVNLPCEELMFIVPVVLTAGHMLGAFVERFEIGSNYIVHVDGRYSGVVDFYHVFCSVTSVCILLRGLYARIFATSLLVIAATLPAILCFALVVLMSRTDYVLDTSLIVPLATIYMVWAFYKIETTDLEASSAMRFLGRISLFIELLKAEPSKQGIKIFLQKFEKQIYEEMLREKNYSIRLASEAMDVHQSTIRAKIKEHGIEVPDT
jgi:hypothetical protein